MSQRNSNLTRLKGKSLAEIFRDFLSFEHAWKFRAGQSARLGYFWTSFSPLRKHSQLGTRNADVFQNEWCGLINTAEIRIWGLSSNLPRNSSRSVFKFRGIPFCISSVTFDVSRSTLRSLCNVFKFFCGVATETKLWAVDWYRLGLQRQPQSCKLQQN